MLARRLRARSVTMVLAIGSLALAAACGGSSGSPATENSPSGQTDLSGTKDAALAAKVPAAVASGGLVVATDPSYAPVEFIDPSGKLVGIDIDLANALGNVLGLKITFQKAIFDNIVAALASGRYDISLSSFTDTKEREQTVDFVTYFSAGTAFVVRSDGPDIKTLADLCGHTVAVESGTTQEHDGKAQSKKCTDAGQDPVKVLSFQDQNGANLAVNSNRAEMTMVDSPVGAYQVQQSDGKLKLTGAPYNTAPYGIAVPKKSGMAPILLSAVKDLMADGTYDAILKKWDVESGAISNPQINGAIF